MIKSLFKVVSQTEPTTINTKNGQTQKSTVVLQETGDTFADSYVASLIGNQVRFHTGDLVWAALRFSHRENNGALYQDIVIKDIVSFSNH